MSALKEIVSPALAAHSTAMVTLIDIQKLEAEAALKERKIQLRTSDLKLGEEIVPLELALLLQRRNNENDAM
ncbi:hypothetical protein V1515DRAFT_577003 [Lipomyces mesembrius]